MKLIKVLLLLGLIGLGSLVAMVVCISSFASQSTSPTDLTPVTMQPPIQPEKASPPKQTSPPESKPIELPEYEIVSSKETETVGKYQILQRATLAKKPSRKQFTALLDHLFADARKVRNDKGRRPNAVYIYVYAKHRYHDEINEAWLGRLEFNTNNGDKEPKIEFSKERIKAQFETPKDKYGLTEDERMTVYYKMIEAEDRAMKKAGADSPDFDAKQFDRLNKKYTDALYDRYKIDKDVATKILFEGINKGWKKPPTD